MEAQMKYNISDLNKRIGVLMLLMILLALAAPVGAAPAGQGLAPEVNVRDGFTNVPDNTGSVTYPDTFVGYPQWRKYFIVENKGRSNLTIGNVTVPNGFTVEYITNTTIKRNGIAYIVVYCNTATAGTFSGTLSFTNNDANENPYNFTISCTVRQPGPPDIAVINELDLSPIPDNTGSIQVTGVRGQGKEIEISVHNEGEGILSFSQPTVPAGFLLTDEFPGIEGSTIFIIRCIGATAGTFSGEVSIDNNDPDENPYNFTVTCTIN
jgi:hypothetical protein